MCFIYNPRPRYFPRNSCRHHIFWPHCLHHMTQQDYCSGQCSKHLLHHGTQCFLMMKFIILICWHTLHLTNTTSTVLLHYAVPGVFLFHCPNSLVLACVTSCELRLAISSCTWKKSSNSSTNESNSPDHMIIMWQHDIVKREERRGYIAIENQLMKEGRKHHFYCNTSFFSHPLISSRSSPTL